MNSTQEAVNEGIKIGELWAIMALLRKLEDCLREATCQNESVANRKHIQKARDFILKAESHLDAVQGQIYSRMERKT